ncbi:MAG: heavy-metal-associated domain-containing protein [Thermoplasmatota archaeon]
MAETTLPVQGMTCQNCVAHVTKALKGVKGVKTVLVDLDDEIAVVTHKDIDERALIAAIEGAGYESNNQ